MTSAVDYLDQKGISYETLPHQRTYTAIDEAGELKIAAEKVLKSIVLRTDKGYALAVIPASRHLDMNLARDAIGAHSVELATEDDLTRDFPDFELSAIPPLPSLVQVPVYVDPLVTRRRSVVFATDQMTSVRTATHDVLHPESVTVVPLVQQPKWAGRSVDAT